MLIEVKELHRYRVAKEDRTGAVDYSLGVFTVPWYAAVLVVQCRVEDDSPQGDVLYDRQIRVLRADDPESAYVRALELGHDQASSYDNAEGKKVLWEFVGLANLTELLDDEITDGTEVYSELERGDPRAAVETDKGKLTAFWAETNKHKTAAELLSEATRPYAPG